MAQNRTMTDAELLALIWQYEKSALGASVAMGPTVGGQLFPAGQKLNTIEVDRYHALNAYYGRPLGNEVEDRSQVVIPELRDTIEWIMPQLMAMFASGKICQFDPERPGDEEQAELETEVINHIFMKENDGFFVLHDFFKDALLLRNGYSKIVWENKTKSSVESYTGLTEIELTELLSPQDGSEIAILEQREESKIQMGPAGPSSYSCFDVKLRRTTNAGTIRVKCVPPEEMLVSPKARSGLPDSPFVEHKTRQTRSELKEDGFDASKVESIGNGTPDWLNLVSLARDEVTDQLAEMTPEDKASQDVDRREVYIRVDYDGDGVSELRRVTVAGDKILENEEAEEIPIASCSPLRMPHRHVGISYYDLLNDLQVIKTTLFRQALDNIYITNNQRLAVNYETVNLSDLLTSRPGGLVRVKGAPREGIYPLVNDSALMQQVLPALEYVDSLREMRTGIGKDTVGVDADALQDVTKGGQLAAMSAASKKVELVARMFAEGVKEIFQLIHSTLIRHQDKPLTIQISGKWVDVDPSQWRERTRVSVNVGLGSGNREDARANVFLLAQMQEKLASFGLVGPKEAYATFKEGLRLLGFESPERFAKDPNSPDFQAPPPQPAPQVQAAQINQQTVLQKAQSDQQIAAGKAQADAQKQNAQLQKELMQSQTELEHAAAQNAQNRDVTLTGMESQEVQELIKAFTTILAAQLKQAPQFDAGQLLAHDVNEAKGLM